MTSDDRHQETEMNDQTNGTTSRRRLAGLPSILLQLGVLGVLVSLTPRLSAQDPAEAVKKILEKVSEEMADIDRLLRESSRKAAGQSSGEAGSDSESAKDLVDETRDSQQRVVRGIDDLIDELQQMAQQSSSSSSSSEDQQDQQQQQQQQQRQRSEREQTQTPDQIDQSQQQQQNQQEQQQQGQQEQPMDGSEDPQAGENKPGQRRPGDPLEEVSRGESGVFEAELPAYAKFLHSRGGAPKVPTKYRRLHEAWLRRVNQQRNR